MMLSEYFKELNFEFIPENEIFNRLKTFQKILQKKDIPVVIITSKVNNFYFTGTNQEQILIIYAEKEPLLLVKRDKLRATLESPLKVISFNSLKELKKYINDKLVGIEYNYLSVAEFLRIKNILSTEFVDISPAILQLRSIKSSYEISIMKKAGKIAQKVYEEAKNYLKEGLTEIEFGSIMFSLAQRYGHEGILRTGSNHFEPVSWHILSGISGCIHGQYDAPASGFGLSPAFPNSASRKKISKHEPIMVDFGICYLGYQVDETRMYCIGEPSDLFYKYYTKILKLNKKIIAEILPNNSSAQIFKTGEKTAKELEVYNEYLGIGKNKKKFVGHGVGLETSEIPLISSKSADIIKENNTIAIEPKLVVENIGIIGIESTYLVKTNSVENITPIPEEILVV